MNYIDILIISPLIYFAWKGYKHGFIIEVFTLLAFFAGIYVGIHFSDYTANFLKDSLGFTSHFVPVISFTLTFLAVGAMVYFLGKTIEKLIKIAQLSTLNKLGGVFFSMLKAAYFMSTIFVLIESYDEKLSFFPENLKQESLLYEPIKSITLGSIPQLKESTIFISNLIGYKKEDSNDK